MAAAVIASMEALYERPGFLLRRAHQISVALFELHCGDLGLTPPQFGVLSAIAASPGIDQATLARALGYDKVTVLHVVRGLEARDLVTRSDGVADRRRISLTLTEGGSTLLARARKASLRASEQLLAPLKPQERAQFLNSLDRICNELEQLARAPMVKLGKRLP